jgi:hypothetical protein
MRKTFGSAFALIMVALFTVTGPLGGLGAASASGAWKWETSLSDSGNGPQLLGESVSADGGSVAVGAPQANNTTGSVLVYTGSGANWSTESKLTAHDGKEFDYFGYSVALEGDTLVVGAPYAGSNNNGAVYVFTRTGSSWVQSAKITGPTGTNFGWGGAGFGSIVAISGGTIAVGAPDAGASSANVGPNGEVYVYTGSGSSWSRQAKLAISGWQMPISLAIDGNTVVLGADPGVSNPAFPEGQAAFVFTRSGGKWAQSAKLNVSNKDQAGWFADSVDIDENTIVVGDPGAGSNFDLQGAAYVFTGSGSSWSKPVKLEASNGGPSSYFGTSVAVDAGTIAVGTGWLAPSDSAYVFSGAGSDWMELAILADPQGQGGGPEVALTGSTVFVGWMGDRNGQGTVRVFSGPTPGIALTLAGPVGRFAEGSPVDFGGERLKSTSSYSLTLSSISDPSMPDVVLAAGTIDAYESLYDVVTLPVLPPGTYELLLYTTEQSGRTLELFDNFVVGDSGDFVTISPNISAIS